MNECKFCSQLSCWQEIFIADNRDAEVKLKQEYSVALLIHTWKPPRSRKSAGRTVSYRKDGYGFKLNYCPECGRKYEYKKGVLII